jgi:hypothetical protein
MKLWVAARRDIDQGESPTGIGSGSLSAHHEVADTNTE